MKSDEKCRSKGGISMNLYIVEADSAHSIHKVIVKAENESVASRKAVMWLFVHGYAAKTTRIVRADSNEIIE